MAGLDLFDGDVILQEEKKPELQNDNFDFFTFNPEIINPVITQEEDDEISLNVQKTQNQPCSAPDFDKWVYFGKSFEYEGVWEPGKMYYNDTHRTSFVSYNNYLLACNKTHESSSETEPVIIYDEDTAKGVENIFWKLVLTAEVGNVDTIEKALAALKKTVDKNQSDLETQNKANIIIANQVQKSTERIQSLENYKTNSSKDIAALKASVDANIAFPWIGSEDEYLALINTEEFDPNKLYFTYEE